MLQLTCESLCEWLVEADLVEDGELAEIAHTTQSALTLAAALLERDLLSEVDLVDVISRKIDVPAAPRRLYKLSVAHKVLQTIPEDLCWQHHLFPFGIDRAGGRLQVAMTDPTDDEAVEALKVLVGHEPQIFVVGPRSLDKAIRKHYLDSWVEETDGKRRRFFGYENLTDPRAHPHRSTPEDELPTSDPPQRGPAAHHVDTPPPEPVDELEQQPPPPPPEAMEEDEPQGTGTDELHAINRVPTRGFAFDNVRSTSDDDAPSLATEKPPEAEESADLPPAPRTDPTSGDELAAASATPDDVARAKKDLDDNITGPLPSREELAAAAARPAKRVAVARILPDDRSTLLTHRIRTLERAVARLMKLLSTANDERLAAQAAALLDELRDDLS